MMKKSDQGKVSILSDQQSWTRGYKTFFLLHSTEHEILNAHKYKNIKKSSFFSDSDKRSMLFVLLINVQMPTIVGISTFMSRKYSCSVELSMKKFITSGHGPLNRDVTRCQNNFHLYIISILSDIKSLATQIKAIRYVKHTPILYLYRV